MKILMLCFNVVGHGTYLRAYEFARSMVAQGHKVTVMATSTHRLFAVRIRYESGIRIVETPDFFPGSLKSGWNPQNIVVRLNWLRNQDFDLVHAFESRPTCLYPALYLKNKGIPLFFDWSDWFGRGGSVEQRPNPVVRGILRHVETYYENRFRPLADANTVICSTLYNKAVMLGIKSDRISIIPNGFNMPGWKVYSNQVARQALSIATDDFLIGYIGSLFPGDAILMSNAFSLLKERIPKLRLVHIGRSNYYLSQYPELIQTGPVSQENFIRYLSACDVCWLPLTDNKANHGRFPLKFSNYLATGKPIVLTNVGDIVDFVRDERVGLICNPLPNDLAYKTYQLYIDLPLRQNCERNARRLSKDIRYSWATRTDQIIKLYRQVIGD